MPMGASAIEGIEMLSRNRGVASAALVLAIAATGFGGCGDDDDDASSTAGLKERLVPAEDVKLEQERDFEWDNPTDFVIQGLYFGEGTAPSEYIGAIDDAGFEAAAGQILTTPDHEVRAFVDVASFDSEDGATEARDAVHAEDLKQPCYAECTVTPTEYEVEGIPDSVAVHHVPNEGTDPKFGGVEAYHVEFTIGSDLYVVQASGPPGLDEDEFIDGATKVYEYAAAHD
jgi:hypothetical protein